MRENDFQSRIIYLAKLSNVKIKEKHTKSNNNDNNIFYAPFLWQLLKDVLQQNEVAKKKNDNQKKDVNRRMTIVRPKEQLVQVGAGRWKNPGGRSPEGGKKMGLIDFIG